MKGEFTAHPFLPELPGDEGSVGYDNELVLPALDQKEKAADIIRFVEWLYLEQRNYDTVVYGDKGLDYNENGDRRFIPMLNGQEAMSPDYDLLMKLHFTWPGAQYMYNLDNMRLPAFVPINMEQLVNDNAGQGIVTPLSACVKPTKKAYLEKLYAMLTSETNQVVVERWKVIDLLLQSTDSYSKENIRQIFTRLADLKGQWLAEQYADIMKRLLREK